MKHLITLQSIIMLFSIMTPELYSATGQVTKSGSTYTAKVDGKVVFTGSRYFDAINEACIRAGNGATINILNSGNSGNDGGSVYAIKPRSGQTLDFHGCTVNCNSNGDLAVAIYADRKSNITVKNIKVTGTPRYGFWFLGCHNVTFTNVTMNIDNGQPVGLGIRYSGRNNGASNLTINGTIDIRSTGHSIETYTVDGIKIGTVTVRSRNGCGVLLNDSKDAVIDKIYAYDCNTGGSYAGFRQANNNGKTYCGYLRAKNCGRGLYVITNSHGTTVNKVDIDDCTSSGISVTGTAYNVRVNSGSVSNSKKNIDIWNGASDICIKVNGNSYGDNCGNSGVGSYSSITNRNSGKCLDVNGKSTSNNASIIQYSCNGGSNQKFSTVDLGNGYFQIKAEHSGKCLREVNGYVVQYSCNDTYWTEMFQKINAGSGYYILKNRSTGKCLRIENSSTSNGAKVDLSDCNTGWWSQQFSSDAFKSTEELREGPSEISAGLFTLYPNVSSNIIYINLPENYSNQAQISIYTNTGIQVTNNILNKEYVDVSKFNSGIYLVVIQDNDKTYTHKFIKK